MPTAWSTCIPELICNTILSVKKLDKREIWTGNDFIIVHWYKSGSLGTIYLFNSFLHSKSSIADVNIILFPFNPTNDIYR